MYSETESSVSPEFLVQEISAPEYVDDWGMHEYQDMGIDPIDCTGAKPGSEEKVLMLSARYAAGIPLWNDSDCYDHGPGMDSEDGEESGMTEAQADKLEKVQV